MFQILLANILTVLSVSFCTNFAGGHCISFFVFRVTKSFLKVGSWGFEGTIILIILFSKLLESTFYKEISKFQQKV